MKPVTAETRVITSLSELVRLRNEELADLRRAVRDMLVVWDGIAHPALAYRYGSPAALLRALVSEVRS